MPGILRTQVAKYQPLTTLSHPTANAIKKRINKVSSKSWHRPVVEDIEPASAENLISPVSNGSASTKMGYSFIGPLPIPSEAQMVTQPDLFSVDVVTSVESTILSWIARSFQSSEHWKKIGREIFISVNGDSQTTRNRLAAQLRSHFTESELHDEEVMRWKDESREQQAVKVSPPKIASAGASYVDWAYVADYVLLACASPDERIAEENTRRDAEYRASMDSYQIRRTVHAARQLVASTPNVSEEKILSELKSNFPDAAMAHVKEAIKLHRAGVKCARLVEPSASKNIGRYQSIYF